MVGILSAVVSFIFIIILYYLRLKHIGGKKGAIIGIIILVCYIIGIVTWYIFKDYEPKTFELDNENKYLVCSITLDDETLYRVDLEKGTLVYQVFSNIDYKNDRQKYPEEWDTLNNTKISLTTEQVAKLKSVFEKVKKLDTSKVFITSEEKVQLVKDKIYTYFEFRDYEDNTYYIKDEETIKEVKEILKY